MLLASAAPGSVVAPGWVLPLGAAATISVPLAVLPVLRSMEATKRAYVDTAPGAQEGRWHAHPGACVVGPAGAKGAGLFAAEHIRKGTYLFDYTGEHLSHAEYLARYPNMVSDYAAALKNPGTGEMSFIDGLVETKCVSPARWMNHDGQHPNVGRRSFFPPDGSAPRILMYAVRDIELGDEMQWNYGDGYWQAHKGMVETEQ